MFNQLLSNLNVYVMTKEEVIEIAKKSAEMALESVRNGAKAADTDEKFLTPKEVTELLNVSITTLNRWEKSGKLTPVRFGTRVRYKMSEIVKIK